MKLIATLTIVAMLAGCASDKNETVCAMNPAPQDPFVERGKNQVGVSASLSEGVSGVVQGAPSNEAQVLAAGAEIVAVVKDQCAAPTNLPAGLTLDSQDTLSTPSGVHSYQWILQSSMTIKQLGDLVKDNDCIVGIADPAPAGISEVNSKGSDPMMGAQTHLSTIGALDSYNTFYGAQGVIKDITIAIIDTGVDIRHEDLKNNLWVNKKEIPGNGIDDDHNGYVDDVNGYNFAMRRSDPSPGACQFCYHGTHVAGLAAAQMGNGVGVSGVMGSHGKIMALNVFGNLNSALSSNIDNAIRYAADNGAQVINMSLDGNGRATSTESALNYAINKGVTIVVAAGNEHTQLSPTQFLTPASFGAQYPGLITIGSVDVNTGLKSYFSNFSPRYVELAVPGSDSRTRTGLLSTMPGNRYGRLQGTSMASPIAAGSAALAIGLMRSRGWNVSPRTIEYLLESSGKYDARIAPYFKEGKSLSLKTIASTIMTRFSYNGNSAAALADDASAMCQAPELH